MERKIKSGVLLLLLCLLSATSLFAKNNNVVKGRVVDHKNRPVEFVTALLRKTINNEVVQGAVSNSKGEFQLDRVRPGTYTLTLSLVGYEKAVTDVFQIGQDETAVVEQNVVLNESVQQLKEATVVGKRKYVEQLADKLVVNPEASATSASENVFDILKKVPGVSVDNNDNISLKGKQGVKIMIDEKPTYVSAEQLATLLKGMQGKNIDKIEVIENPSARYDAEGNSGIINIKTKHNRASGFNGSVNGGFNQGKRFGENGGIDLSLKYDKFNIYGNYSFYDWRNWHSLDGTRRFTSAELVGATQQIFSKSDNDGNAHNYKMGIDYYLAKNQVLSVMFRGSNGYNLSPGNSRTGFYDKDQQLDSVLITGLKMDNRWQNSTTNINYKWDIDTTGRSLTIDADYAQFYFKGLNNQGSNYFNGAGVDLHRDFGLQATQTGTIDIVTMKADYVHPIGKKITVEAGLKSSFVTNDGKSDFEVQDETHSIWDPALNKHDHFVYDENINAAYLSGRFQLGKTSLQTGLRLENTHSKGHSYSLNEINENNYTNLFPSLFLQQSFNESNQLGFSYSYRIGRPSYHELNPFVWIIDPYTYEKGNPFLKPQFTHSIGLNHTYKGKFITSVGLNTTDHYFTEIIQQNDETKVIYQTKDNLSKALDFNVSETVQLDITKWWKVNGTASSMFKKVNSDLAGGSEFKRWSYSANLQNSLSLPRSFNLEINGYYQSKQLWGNFFIYEQYSIDLGIQKNILNNKGTLKLSVNDVFNTNSGGGYTRYGNVDLSVMNHWDSRRVNLSFSYRFGKDTFSTRANRTTASSEEQSRSAKN